MSPVVAGAVVLSAVFATVGVMQRVMAVRERRQALSLYEQAEALVVLAAQYRQCGDDAFRDANDASRDARSLIEEWST